MLAILALEYWATLRRLVLDEDHCLSPCQSIGGISYIAAATPNELNEALIKISEIWEICCKPCMEDLDRSSHPPCLIIRFTTDGHGPPFRVSDLVARSNSGLQLDQANFPGILQSVPRATTVDVSNAPLLVPCFEEPRPQSSHMTFATI